MQGEIEIWKDIPGFEGRYSLSSFGVAKSLRRKIGKGSGYWVDEKVLKLVDDKDGYKQISITASNRKNKTFIIPRLVAKMFIDSKIPDDAHICHRDADKSNNRVSNLYIGVQGRNFSLIYKIKENDKSKNNLPSQTRLCSCLEESKTGQEE